MAGLEAASLAGGIGVPFICGGAGDVPTEGAAGTFCGFDVGGGTWTGIGPEAGPIEVVEGVG